MRLGIGGWSFLVIGATLIATAYLARLPGLLWAGCLLVILVLVSAITALITAGALQIRIRVPGTLVSGTVTGEVDQPIPVEIDILNRHVLPTRGEHLTLSTAPAFGPDVSTELPQIPSRRRRTIRHAAVPRMRGLHHLGAGTLTIQGPFRLARVRRSVGHAVTTAISAPIHLMSLPGENTAVNAMEDSTRHAAGNATRDFHAREYVPGDDLRHVHWKTTARLGELMVRHESEEQVLSAIILIDQREAAYDGPESFELMAIGATSAAAAFLRRGYEVTLLASDTPPRTLAGSSALGRLRLASASLEQRGDASLPAWPGHLSRPTQIVACTGSDGAGLLQVVPKRTRVRAVVLASDEQSEPADSLHRQIFHLPRELPAAWRRLSHEVRA